MNPTAFFEDDGECALSILSSVIANKPDKFTASSAGKAFRLRKVTKSVFAEVTPFSTAEVFFLLLFIYF